MQIRSGSVSAGKRGKRADHHGLVEAQLELHFRMECGIGILKLVLSPAMNTLSLHDSNLTLAAWRSCGLFPPHVARVICGTVEHKSQCAEADCPPLVLRLKIPIQPGERL